MEYSFEKLDVWKKGIEVVKIIYGITADFPDQEKYGLSSQMKRSIISVTSNIAEGSCRVSSKDQAHFYQIAYGSLIELLSQLIISKELGFIDQGTYNNTRTKIEEVSNLLNSLRKSCLKRMN